MAKRRRLLALLCGVALLAAGCSHTERPDGAGRTLFVTEVAEGSDYDELFAVDLATGARRNLKRTPTVSESPPAASPDGRRRGRLTGS